MNESNIAQNISSMNDSEIKGNILRFLKIRNFRNIQEQEFFPHSEFNFFFGENAQGKTSILEAIYFLSELRSFRVSELRSLILHTEEKAQISAKFELLELFYDLKVEIFPAEKKILLNEKTPKPYRRLRKLFPIILFTPDSTRLFRSSPSSRREYFDHLFSILSESFSLDIQNYSKVLKQKLRLIEESKKMGKNPTLNELEVWNEKLAEIGSRIIVQRFEFSKELSIYLNSIFQEIAESSWKTKFYYQPYLNSIQEGLSILEIHHLLKEEMEKRSQDEIDRLQILVGPHRDDWNYLLHNKNLKEEGSQGQHRLVVASLKLAETELMRKFDLFPIALFDDLLSELDEIRSLKVLKALEKNQTQVFLTSIAPPQNSFHQFHGKNFRLVQGKIVAN